MVGSGGWVTIHIGGKSLLYLPVGIVPSGNSTSGKGLSEKKGLTCVTYWMTNMCNLLNECLWTGQQKTAWLNDWIVWSRSDWFFELALLWAISPLNNLFFHPSDPEGCKTRKQSNGLRTSCSCPLRNLSIGQGGRRKTTRARFLIDLLTQLLVIDLGGKLVTCFDLVTSRLTGGIFPLVPPTVGQTTEHNQTLSPFGKKTPLSRSWLKASLVSNLQLKLLEPFWGYTWSGRKPSFDETESWNPQQTCHAWTWGAFIQFVPVILSVPDLSDPKIGAAAAAIRICWWMTLSCSSSSGPRRKIWVLWVPTRDLDGDATHRMDWQEATQHSAEYLNQTWFAWESPIDDFWIKAYIYSGFSS